MQSCRAPVSWVRDRLRYRIPASPYIKYDARMTPPAPTLLPLAPDTLDRLGRISTPTLTTQLFTLGFRNTFLAGVRLLCPERRMAGEAVTVRFAPAREDRDRKSTRLNSSH